MIQQYSISRGRGGGGAIEIWARGHNMKGPPAWSSGGSLDRDPLGGLRNYPLLSTTSVDFNRNAFLIHYLPTALKEAAQPSILTLTRNFYLESDKHETIHPFSTDRDQDGCYRLHRKSLVPEHLMMALSSVETLVMTELSKVFQYSRRPKT